MRSYKRILSTCLSVALALQIWGAKVLPQPITVTQSDGTQLVVYGYGDEHLSWHTTADGVLLVHVGHDFYIATIDTEGNLTATPQLAHEAGARREAERKLVAAQDKETFLSSLTAQRQCGMMRNIGIGSQTPAYFPHTGSPKALVILVEFDDVKFSCANPVATFNNYLNGTELADNDINQSRNYGSVKDYFTTMSNGKFAPEFDVKGPVTMPEASKYYGENVGSTKDAKVSEMMAEACRRISDINISDYDANGDGVIDLVYFIYAGYSESISGNSSDCIWPKSGSAKLTIGGKSQTVRYGINNELNYTADREFASGPKNRINGIGLFCHEFSHTLGLPDLYYTGSMQIDNQGLEYWDLMDAGEYMDNGYTPTPYTPWEKEVMGWQSVPTASTAKQYCLGTDETLKIEGENNEYVILHNLQKEGWASKLPGHGMLVYRIDYPKNKVNLGDYPNNTIGKPGITIVPADGLLMAMSNASNQTEYYNQHAGDIYPGSQNVREITSITLNKSTMEKPIYNINETADGKIYFDFLEKFSTNGIDGLLTPDTNPNAPIYTIDGRYAGNSTEGLAKGVYLRGNRKFVVK